MSACGSKWAKNYLIWSPPGKCIFSMNFESSAHGWSTRWSFKSCSTCSSKPLSLNQCPIRVSILIVKSSAMCLCLFAFTCCCDRSRIPLHVVNWDTVPQFKLESLSNVPYMFAVNIDVVCQSTSIIRRSLQRSSMLDLLDGLPFLKEAACWQKVSDL